MKTIITIIFFGSKVFAGWFDNNEAELKECKLKLNQQEYLLQAPSIATTSGRIPPEILATFHGVTALQDCEIKSDGMRKNGFLTYCIKAKP